MKIAVTLDEGPQATQLARALEALGIRYSGVYEDDDGWRVVIRPLRTSLERTCAALVGVVNPPADPALGEPEPASAIELAIAPRLALTQMVSQTPTVWRLHCAEHGLVYLTALGYHLGQAAPGPWCCPHCGALAEVRVADAAASGGKG